MTRPCRREKEQGSLGSAALPGLLEIRSVPVIAGQRARCPWPGFPAAAAICMTTSIHSVPAAPASPLQCFFISVPDILFIFLLNILPRLCLKMRGGKKPSTFLVKAVARETTRHHSQNTKTASRHSEVSSESRGQDRGCGTRVRGTRRVLLRGAAEMKPDF